MIEYILGLDIGTTTVSWSVTEKNTFKQVEASNTANDSSIGTAIQDPERLLKICLEILEDARKRFENISAIGITGQMHGIVVIDKDGNSVSPLYTWQYSADLQLCNLIEKKTGKKAYPGYGLVTVCDLLKRKKFPSNASSFCSIMDYVAMKLCNKTKPVIHSSVAASFGLFNLETNSFDSEACRKLCLDTSIFPEVTGESAVIGEYRGALVFVPIGDNQASFMGVVLNDGNTLCINCGTGSQVSVAVDDYHGHNCQEVRPYVDGKYLLTGSALCGGRSLAILEKFFRRFAVAAGFEDKCCFEVMDRLVKDVNDTELTVDSRFCGTRENPEIRGSICNITESNFTPENLIKGFIDGMAQELYDFYAEMKLSGIRHIAGSGNGIRKNTSFMKTLSEKFGMDIELSTVSEEAAFGVCLFAGRNCESKG